MDETRCDKCNQVLRLGEWPFCPHGFGANGVVDDTIIGGEVNENVGPEPVTFYSKSERRRYLKEHNLEEFVRHVRALTEAVRQQAAGSEALLLARRHHESTTVYKRAVAVV